MKNVKITIGLVVVVLFYGNRSGFGATFFSDGGTHNINYTINDNVYVDNLAPGMQTIVNLLNGGRIPSSYKLETYEDSRTNITGGSVDNILRAYNRSQITMSSGSVRGLETYDNSQVTMPGGSVSNLYAYGSSQVTISGVVVGNLYAFYDSRVNWSVGRVGYVLMLDTAATLTIYGSNFAIDGTPFGPGEITSILGGYYQNESYRTLTGTLANGDIINNQFKIGSDAKIVLVAGPPPPVCLEKPVGDFNNDCKVDFEDFAIFASSWLKCNLDPPSACWE